MKEKLLLAIFIVILIVGLFAISNYINNETIKRIKSNDSNISNDINTISEPNERLDENQDNLDIPIEVSQKIGIEDFEEKVLKSNKKVVVDFYADWCGPCKMLSPILEEVINNQDEYLLYKVDTDKERDLSSRYRIMYLPTLVIFENGKEVNRSIGLISKEEIVELLK